MSAKLGIATGMNLPRSAARSFPKPVTIGLWIQAELIAMATDLAEFIGAALASTCCSGCRCCGRACSPACSRSGCWRCRRSGGFRHFEAAIVCLVGDHRRRVRLPDAACPPRSRPALAHGMFVPAFSGTESVLLAAGILGATVMPHVIYLHSALTQRRVVGRTDDAAARDLPVRADRRDHRDDDRRAGQHVDADRRRRHLPRLGLAGVDSHRRAPTPGSSTIVGDHAETVFEFALLASGLSSSSVGTLAGQVVMQGFVSRRSRCLCAAPCHDGARRCSCWRSASIRPGRWC